MHNSQTACIELEKKRRYTTCSKKSYCYNYLITLYIRICILCDIRETTYTTSQTTRDKTSSSSPSISYPFTFRMAKLRRKEFTFRSVYMLLQTVFIHLRERKRKRERENQQHVWHPLWYIYTYYTCISKTSVGHALFTSGAPSTHKLQREREEEKEREPQALLLPLSIYATAIRFPFSHRRRLQEASVFFFFSSFFLFFFFFFFCLALYVF